MLMKSVKVSLAFLVSFSLLILVAPFSAQADASKQPQITYSDNTGLNLAVVPTSINGFKSPKLQWFVGGKAVAGATKATFKATAKQIDEPTTSRLARNDSDYLSPINESKKEKKESKVEPDSYYNAVYPYNNVYESESGHALEFDDTKDAERIHLYHRSGSYVEWGPEGDRAERIEKDKFTVVVGNDSVYVKGDVKVYVDGNVNLEVGGDVTATVEGNLTGDVSGSATVSVGGSATLDVGGNFNADIGGSCTISSSGRMKFNAPRIDLN